MSHDETAAAKSSGSLPGDPNDFLYVIVQGKFYRLTPAEVKAHAPIQNAGNDKEVFKALTELQKLNAAVADLPGGGLGAAASCICVAVNLDVFEASLSSKMAGK